MADQHPQQHPQQASGASRRTRPSKRVASAGAADPSAETTLLTPDFMGLAVAYGNTLLFIGYEVNGLVEITVYPRYRFSSDDRVQGHLGYVRVPMETPWEEILLQVDEVFETAQRNYRSAVTLRTNALRAHGSRYESAYDEITEIFRESWHGFALRLLREGQIEKNGVTFTGVPPGPVLALWRGEPYTVQVYETGSITMVRGDQLARFGRLSDLDE